MNDITYFYNNKLTLSTDRIYVFVINFGLYNSDDFVEILSSDENNRADEMRSVEKRRQFIITRGITKRILATSLDRKPSQIKFLYNQHGKPFINDKYNDYTIEFNTSHSELYGLIAMTLNSKVGVDIQKIKPLQDISALSSRFFSDNERNELMRIDENKQQDAFYLGWVRKESFIKAVGTGVAYGLDRFTVPLSKKENKNIIIPDFENKKWHCYDLIEFENYKTALTTCKDNIDILIAH
jgi:4'-phosphopantetheinyl transferase